jgi:hypothetical protein
MEKDKRLLSLYGIVPSRENLLHHQLEVSKKYSTAFMISKNLPNSVINGREESISIRVILPSSKPIDLPISVPSRPVANTPFGEIYQTLRVQYRALAILTITPTSIHHLRRKLAS